MSEKKYFLENYTMLFDFYELTMANGYYKTGMADKIAYFDIFFREVPDNGGFAIAAGLEQIIDYINNLHFSDEDIEYLRSKNCFDEKFLESLRSFRPGVDLPLKENGKLDVGGAIGRGELTVVKDLGLKEPYVGTVSLVSGEIAEDLTSYYYISEQQNTAISLGVKIERDYSVGCAGGMIVQLLPDASEDSVAALEKIIGDMEPITTLIDRVEDSGADESLRLLLKEIFGRIPEEFAIEELEIKNMDWNCDCSFERLEKILMTIGERDLNEIIEEDGEAELVCQFCLKKYKFDKAHLEKILASIR